MGIVRRSISVGERIEAIRRCLILHAIADNLVKTCNFYGFPVVSQDELMGFVTRAQLKEALGLQVTLEQVTSTDTRLDGLPDEERTKVCLFSPMLGTSSVTQDHLDFSHILDKSVLHLRKDVPQELVVRMFQTLVSEREATEVGVCIHTVPRQSLRQILFTHSGKLEGMVTKTDVAALLTSHFPYTGALSHEEPSWTRQ